MLYFVRTTNICRPTNLTILQYELYLFFSSVSTLLGGGGGAATVPELCHIRSSVIFLGNR